ncbi:MBL fold metallo-hydrolase [Cellulomonas uda]|uniref:Metallo-beta-lactamase domain-containing protein n=1 Tax=Cellulomonas uda TaxID=1714 RepID=A0A4Y3KCJ0_CELUD|nr:MBL fold metallo-hydrolase [Cellulomonas uda]NII65863.1 L-ascorbate metabolism protein UlaG (beta-lactamase superfamily) [Cellulomonas uda]GEA80708.1 hypothetical protein CUD01_11520 [Cellulomonas uda]
MTLRLTRWGHSCVRFDDETRHLVVDPGAFSRLDDALAGAQAILVTHEHADHLAVETVADAVRGGVPLWGPAPVVALLREAGAPQERLHVVSGGDHVEAAGFQVRVLGEWHAVIHPDIPRIPNVAYLVAGVLHPGDAHVQPTDAPDVLLLPISGPWFSLTDAVDRARDIGARRIVPIHDGLLNDRGLGLLHALVGRLVRDSELVVLTAGESLELAHPGGDVMTGTHPDLPPHADEIPLLEQDETIPPRPEEEVADVARAVPDPLGHGGGQ